MCSLQQQVCSSFHVHSDDCKCHYSLQSEAPHLVIIIVITIFSVALILKKLYNLSALRNTRLGSGLVYIQKSSIHNYTVVLSHKGHTHTHIHTNTHARTHTRTHARTHARTHTHTHTHSLSLSHTNETGLC